METSAHESPQTIYVRTLGGFSITVDGKEINDNSNQSKKPWSLLEYLVVFQKKDISVNELIETIWPDDRLRGCWSSSAVPTPGPRTLTRSWTSTSSSPCAIRF